MDKIVCLDKTRKSGLHKADPRVSYWDKS